MALTPGKQGASARLRKAFKYPSDDSDSEPEAMDEEEQEQLIQSLRNENEQKNDFWIKCLLGLTMSAFLAFLPLAIKSRAYQAKLLCLLCITSVFATGYILTFIPTKKANGLSSKSSLTPASDLSPLQRYMPYLNGALSLLVGFNGMTWRDKPGAADGLWIASWLPTVVFTTIVIARQVLIEVDPDELWDLKYELKGA